MNLKLTTLKLNVTELIRKDVKKTVVLGVLSLVLLGMWVTRATGKTPGPSTAVASVVGKQKTVREHLGQSDLPATDQDIALQEFLHHPIMPLGRNLFVVKLDYFPQDGRMAETLRAPVGDGFWDEVAKSMTQQADQRKERQILIENLRLQAAQLRLETTMMGTKPKALINGQLVGEGEVVANFRVLKIEARRIIVGREGIKLEIRMK